MSVRKYPEHSRIAEFAGWSAFALVLCWYAISLRANVMVGGRILWVPTWSFLGLDFLHNYRAATYWVAGGNPYTQPFGDPAGRALLYPPPILPAFAWCRFFTAEVATRIWFVASVATTTVLGVETWRERVRRRGTAIPAGLVCALPLCSTPFLFEIERGNCNILALGLVFGAGVLLERNRKTSDITAGALLAIATSIKLYPGIAVLVLAVLGLHTALFAFVGVGMLLLALSARLMPAYVANASAMAVFHPVYDRGGLRAIRVTHTLSGYWEYLQAQYPLLRHIPGIAIAIAAIVIPLFLALWIARDRSKTEVRERIGPTLLVAVGAGTFIPPVAYDYSLIFLVIALMILWDHRRPLIWQLMVLASLLWLQPFAIPAPFPLLYGSKYLLALALCWAAARPVNEAGSAPSALESAS